MQQVSSMTAGESVKIQVDLFANENFDNDLKQFHQINTVDEKEEGTE